MILRPSLPLSIISESPTKGFISSTTFPLLSCSTEPSCCPNAAPRRGPTYHHHCSCSNTFVLGQVASRQMLAHCWPSSGCSSAGSPAEPGSTVLSPAQWGMHAQHTRAMGSASARKPHPSPSIPQPPAGSPWAVPVPSQRIAQSQELNREEIPVHPSNHSSPPVPHFPQTLCKGFPDTEPRAKAWTQAKAANDWWKVAGTYREHRTLSSVSWDTCLCGCMHLPSKYFPQQVYWTSWICGEKTRQNVICVVK